MSISTADDIRMGTDQVYAVYLGTDLEWEILPDAMIVEGAGSVATNGVYLRNGDSLGSPVYILPTGVRIEARQDAPLSPTYYSIHLSILGNSFDYYRSFASVSSPDQVGDWAVSTDGSLPLPAVRYATWNEIDAAGIDRDDVPIRKTS